ncbi:hypothetical protein LAN30_22950, partial [Mycobacterium tuberculosis]|nr:hypothetical protein [Mycobacterium tuberculosis]
PEDEARDAARHIHQQEKQTPLLLVPRAAQAGEASGAALDAQAADVEQRLKDLVNQEGNENWAKIRDEMGLSMEEGCGIYRTPELMQKTIDKLAELQERFKR